MAQRFGLILEHDDTADKGNPQGRAEGGGKTNQMQKSQQRGESPHIADSRGQLEFLRDRIGAARQPCRNERQNGDDGIIHRRGSHRSGCRSSIGKQNCPARMEIASLCFQSPSGFAFLPRRPLTGQ